VTIPLPFEASLLCRDIYRDGRIFSGFDLLSLPATVFFSKTSLEGRMAKFAEMV